MAIPKRGKKVSTGSSGKATGHRGNIANLRPFKPGQSGNPSGTSKVAREFKQLCRQAMDEGGFEAMLKLAKTGRPEMRFKAWEWIAAYAYGRPSQEIKHASDEPFKLVLDLVPPPRPVGAGTSERLQGARRQLESGEQAEP